MSEIEVPEGFNPFPLDNSFTDMFAPLFIAMTDKGPQIGMRVQEHHLNGIGICHGAVYMNLLDVAFAAIVGHSMGKYAGTPTISIDINFMASSKEGEWIYTDVNCLKLSNLMGFTQGIVRSESEVKVSGNGVFKLPPDLDKAHGITVEELKKMSF